MSEQIATQKNVREAIAALRFRGESVTYNAVRQLIGGGSKSTILNFMREERQSDSALQAPADVPTAFSAVCNTFLAGVWAAAKAEAEQLHSAEVTRFAKRYDEFEKLLEESRADEELSLAAAKEASELYGMASEENATLRVELAAARAEAESWKARARDVEEVLGQEQTQRKALELGVQATIEMKAQFEALSTRVGALAAQVQVANPPAVAVE